MSTPLVTLTVFATAISHNSDEAGRVNSALQFNAVRGTAVQRANPATRPNASIFQGDEGGASLSLSQMNPDLLAKFKSGKTYRVEIFEE